MSDSTLTDRIRALVEGTLSAERAEAVRREIDGDPEARALLADYREVHELTAPLVQDAPPTSLSLEDVVERTPAAPSRGPWRLAAAAALLLCVTALATWRALTPAGPGVVELSAIPLGELAAAPAPQGVPHSLASFDPTTADGVRWLDSLDDGYRIAAMVDRPVLLFVDAPGCPYCEWMDANTFPSAAVRDRFGDFVPVRLSVLDLAPLPQEELPELLRGELTGWPVFGVLDTTGNTLAAFPGKHDADSFRTLLDDALADVINHPVDWSEARELSARVLQAERARAEGRLADAWRLYAELAARPGGTFGALGESGRLTLERAARERLDAARDAGDPEAARAVLDEAVPRFLGTPLGDELALVRDSLRERGAFPVLRSVR